MNQSSQRMNQRKASNELTLSQVNAPKQHAPRAASTGQYHAQKFIKTLKLQVDNSTNYKHQTDQILKKIEMNYDDKWEECLINNAKLGARAHTAGRVHNNILYVYGGFEMNKGILGDFWKIDLNAQTHQWEQVLQSARNNPGPRCRHGIFVHEDNLYLFGGMIKSQKNSSDLFQYNFSTKKWKIVDQKNNISPIDSFQLLEDKENKCIYIVGGFQSDRTTFSNGIYQLNLDDFSWKTIFKNNQKDKSAMCGRISFGAALDSETQKIYCFGGFNGEKRLNDLWNFDLKTKKWGQMGLQSEITPSIRSGNCLQVFNNELILFGGLHQVTHELDDLYVFNIEQNQWKELDQNSTTRLVQDQKNKSTMESPSKKPVRIKSPIKKLRSAVHKLQMQTPMTLMHSTNNNDESETYSPNHSPMLPSINKTTNFMQNSNYQNFFGNNSECASPLKNQAEIKYKKFLMRKTLMLKEFDLDDSATKEIKKDLVPSPLSTQMQYKLENLGNPNPKVRIRANKLTDFGRKTMCNFSQPLSSNEKTKVGKRPCARDGALSLMIGDKILIFGGDRHQFSFNDLFYLNLQKLHNSNKTTTKSLQQ